MSHRNVLGLFISSWRRCSVKEGVLKKFAGFTGKHLRWSCQAWAYNFVKMRLQHKCFSVKFAKILRTSILKNICKKLLLFVSPQNAIANNSGEFALDETLRECKVSFFKRNSFVRSNAAISFIKYKLKNVPLTCQITFLLNF